MNNEDQAEDWWLKTSGATLETWALLEVANDGSARIRFINDTRINDTREEFGELNFTSIEKAIEALRRNEFRRYLEDKIIQGIWRPPCQPFQRIERPNLLCSIFWTDIPVSETSILQKISAMLKKYEPGFELEEAFVSGVRGRADPNFSATREERFRHLGLSPQNFSLAVMFADDYSGDDGPEADPRINWRVTARHGDYYIHIMALDQGLSRFACCLQTSTEFEEGLVSEHRSRCTLYKTGNLAEIEKILLKRFRIEKVGKPILYRLSVLQSFSTQVIDKGGPRLNDFRVILCHSGIIHPLPLHYFLRRLHGFRIEASLISARHRLKVIKDTLP